MKRLFIFTLSCLALLAISFSACSEADREMFDTSFASICFSKDSVKDVNITNKDSILVFTFAPFPVEMTSYDVEVPVLVTGIAMDHDRQFQLAIDPANTTGVEGVNFEKLQSSYTMPAGKVCTYVPIRLLRTEDIQSKQLQITLKAVSGGDFNSPVLDDKATIKIQFSDQLEKPIWWDSWILWFGKYSRVKYQKWLSLYGTDESYLSAQSKVNNYAMFHPKVAVLQNALREYFIENPTYDEDGELISVPALQ